MTSKKRHGLQPLWKKEKMLLTLPKVSILFVQFLYFLGCRYCYLEESVACCLGKVIIYISLQICHCVFCCKLSPWEQKLLTEDLWIYNSKIHVQITPAPLGWLIGERVGLMTWRLWVWSLVEANFLYGVFLPLTSSEVCEKSSRWLWKEKLC